MALRDKRANRYLQLDPPEYYADRLMAGATFVTGDATHPPTIGLYNDGTAGRPLTLLDLQLSLSSPGGVQLGFAQGHLGTGPFVGAPLNPEVQLREGSFFSSANSNPIPGNPYSFRVGTVPYQWPHDWGIATVPVGWSMIFQGDGTGATLTVAAIWMIEPDR